MWKLLVVTLVGSIPVWADDRKPALDEIQPPKEKPAVSLKPGDPAPPLKVSRWLQGDAVKAFEKDKVYVVEFWATWCGPCIAVMPHLSELQTQYKNKGVAVIGFTAADPKNTEDQVAAFVKERGPKLKYTFAFADDAVTMDTWMKAAGREGIPCSFVVDKAGKIAYTGHPMYLDLVLPKVVAGTATAREVGEELAKVQTEFGTVSETLARDPKAGLVALHEFETRYPPLSDFLPSVRARLSYLPKYGKPGEAKEYAEKLVAKATERGDRGALRMVASILRLGDGKDSPELLAVAVRAAEAEARLAGDKDAEALLNLATVHLAAGDRAKTREYARKAVEAAADGPRELRLSVERDAKALEAQAQPDKK